MTSSPEGFPPQDLRSFLELCAGEWLALRSHFDLALVEPGENAGSDADAGEDAAVEPTSAAAGAASAGAADSPASAPHEANALAGGGFASDSGGTAAAGWIAAPANPDGESTGTATATADSGGETSSDGLPDFAALLAQARAGVEEAPLEEAWHRSERAELQVAFLSPAQADQVGGLRVTPPGGTSRELHFRGDGSFAAAPQGPAEGRWQLWPDGSVELIVEASGRLLRERIWFTQPNLRLRSSVEHGEGGLPGRARFSSEIRRVRKPAP